MFRSTKTYTTDFSTAFRQWRALSHCSYIHGYALGITFVFEAEELDENNWVVDFGALKSLKEELKDVFDHTTLVAHDDPHRDWFEEAHSRGIMKVIIVEATGCEKFAHVAGSMAQDWLRGNAPHAKLVSCTVFEHSGNSAVWLPTDMK